MKRFLDLFNKLEEGVLAVSLLGLALLAFGEVVGRYLFNHSFTWFEELSRYMGVFLTFLGASLGVKYGLHFSMDFMVSRAGPRTACAMRALGALISAALFLAVAWYAWEHALKMKRFGVTSAAMKLPMIWAYMPIAVFGFTLGLRFLRQSWINAYSMLTGKPLPAETPPQPQEEAAS